MVAKKKVTKKKATKKKEVWYCWDCGELIDPYEKIAILGTYDKGEEIEVAYFHFLCWRDHFKEKVQDAADKMQTAGSLMENVGRSPNILGMLGNLSKLLPKNFNLNLKNLQDIDPKEIQRVLKDCGIDLKETKKKHGKRKTKK